MRELMPAVLTAVMMILASITDARSMRIPNIITFSGMTLGCVYIAMLAPDVWLLRGTAALTLFLAGSLGVMGLGDIKLLMAVSLLMGPWCAGFCLGAGCLLLVAFEFAKRPGETSAAIADGTRALLRLDLFMGTENGKKKAFAPYMAAGYAIYIGFTLLSRG
jgi:Flp pilus assembly protein protease CpaA